MGYDFHFVLLFGLAILFTGLAYAIGISIVRKRIARLWPFIIGFVVVTAGYLAHEFNAPLWLVILLPIPLGIILLWFAMKQDIKKTALSYLLTWIVYVGFHILLSAVFAYDSLIPAWRLHP